MGYKLTKTLNNIIDFYITCVVNQCHWYLVTVVNPDTGVTLDDVPIVVSKLEGMRDYGFQCAILAFEEHDGRKNHKKRKAKEISTDEPKSPSASQSDIEYGGNQEDVREKITGKIHLHLMVCYTRPLPSTATLARQLLDIYPDTDVKYPSLKGYNPHRMFKYALKGHGNHATSRKVTGVEELPHVIYYESTPHSRQPLYAMLNKLKSNGLKIDYQEREVDDELLQIQELRGTVTTNHDRDVDSVVSYLQDKCTSLAEVEATLRNIYKIPEIFALYRKTAVHSDIARFKQEHPQLLYTTPIVEEDHAEHFENVLSILLHQFDYKSQLFKFLEHCARLKKNLVHERREPHMFIVGPSSSGKSTISSMLSTIFANPVSLCQDGRFTLQPIVSADAVVHDEFSSALLPCNQMLQFLEGGPMAVACRNRDAVQVDWKGHVIMTSNVRLNYPNVTDGRQEALDNRVIYYEFKALPISNDPSILTGIKKEAKEFFKFVEGGKDMWEQNARVQGRYMYPVFTW